MNNSKQINSRIILGETGLVYVLLAKDIKISRESRKTELEIRCFIARDSFPKKSTVIGIATEIPGVKKGFSLDLYCFHKETWTDEDHSVALEAKARTQYFVNPRISNYDLDEYPLN